MGTIDENILIKYIDGVLAGEEQAEVESWLADSPDNEKLLEQVYFTLQVTNRLRVIESVDTEKALLRFKSRISKQNRKVSMHRTFIVLQQIAAVLFIPVLVAATYLLMQQGENAVHTMRVHSNPGVVSSFDLPDGSKVWLNAGSTLTYPSEFTADNRMVELNGQGYFEVTKNRHQPFIVKAGTGYAVEVLGTSFNVSAYSDDDLIETTLVEGSVKLMITGINGKQITRKLEPNQKADYQKGSDQLDISAVNTEYDTAWKNGEIIFRNHPMDQVLKVLSRHYRVKFDVQDEQAMSSIITARFKDEQLPEVMEYLRLASCIKYKIKKPDLMAGEGIGACIVEISK